MHHTIEAGNTAVTIVAEDDRVWVAATIGGRVAAAEGMRFGGLFADTGAHLPGMESPRRWRPVYTRARYAGRHWLWLTMIVNAARMDAGNRTPAEVAGLIASRMRRYLSHKYRNG